jgi:hypothetical protein
MPAMSIFVGRDERRGDGLARRRQAGSVPPCASATTRLADRATSGRPDRGDDEYGGAARAYENACGGLERAWQGATFGAGTERWVDVVIGCLGYAAGARESAGVRDPPSLLLR